MAKYFLNWTALGALERDMMVPTGFTRQLFTRPRFAYTPAMCDCNLCIYAKQQKKYRKDGTCVCLEERIAAGCIIEPADSASLEEKRVVKRAGRLCQHMGTQPLGDGRHITRLHELMRHGAQLLLKKNSRYAAAVFLLCANRSLWEKSKGGIGRNQINFSRISMAGIDSESYILLQAAKDIYLGGNRVEARDLADKRLIPNHLFRLIIHADYIQRFGLPDHVWEAPKGVSA